MKSIAPPVAGRMVSVVIFLLIAVVLVIYGYRFCPSDASDVEFARVKSPVELAYWEKCRVNAELADQKHSTYVGWKKWVESRQEGVRVKSISCVQCELTLRGGRPVRPRTGKTTLLMCGLTLRGGRPVSWNGDERRELVGYVFVAKWSREKFFGNAEDGETIFIHWVSYGENNEVLSTKTDLYKTTY